MAEQEKAVTADRCRCLAWLGRQAVAGLSMRWLPTVIGLILLAVLCLLLYGWGRSRLAEAVYRRRLQDIARDYGALASQYNAVVRRTAVTEIEVTEGRVAIVIRDAAGGLRRLATPYRSEREIYVDYVVLDGRLWIRRVFDAATPPDGGIVVDPALASIDWDQPAARYGKAVYRQLAEGRWIITVTGDGSLGLAPLVKGQPEPTLSPPPPVKDYAEIEADIHRDLDSFHLWDLLRL